MGSHNIALFLPNITLTPACYSGIRPHLDLGLGDPFLLISRRPGTGFGGADRVAVSMRRARAVRVSAVDHSALGVVDTWSAAHGGRATDRRQAAPPGPARTARSLASHRPLSGASDGPNASVLHRGTRASGSADYGRFTALCGPWGRVVDDHSSPESGPRPATERPELPPHLSPRLTSMELATQLAGGRAGKQLELWWEI